MVLHFGTVQCVRESNDQAPLSWYVKLFAKQFVGKHDERQRPHNVFVLWKSNKRT